MRVCIYLETLGTVRLAVWGARYITTTAAAAVNSHIHRRAIKQLGTHAELGNNTQSSRHCCDARNTRTRPVIHVYVCVYTRTLDARTSIAAASRTRGTLNKIVIIAITPARLAGRARVFSAPPVGLLVFLLLITTCGESTQTHTHTCTHMGAMR